MLPIAQDYHSHHGDILRGRDEKGIITERHYVSLADVESNIPCEPLAALENCV